MKRLLNLGVILLTAAVAAAAGGLTEREMQARLYDDLGPDSVDVGAYPKGIQDDYKIFAEKCSQCHTLARPINAPLASKQDWDRYVRRMKARIGASSKMNFTAAEQKKIVDFLVYDSKIRKIDHKAEFAELTKSLKARYEEVKRERAARLSEEDRRKAKSGAHENTQPSPQP